MVLKPREVNLDNDDWKWLKKYCVDVNDGTSPSRVIRGLIKDFRQNLEGETKGKK